MKPESEIRDDAVARPIPSAAGLANQLKLVIWDLDDTFWQGTLSEERVTLLDHNVEIVKELCERGIISSICSKNIFDDAKAVLTEHGVWDYFVFPKIAFEAKGSAIASMIEEAGLRPDNVLFLDDNPLNLAEARHFSPTLMTALPEEMLPTLLGLPHAAGKPDPQMTRLQQYRNLEKKVQDRTVTDLSTAAFLRSCDIKVEIDYELDEQLDRVVELINRSNQLNYTKKRIETAEARDAFRASLDKFGAYAGVVRAQDRYGDYGVVGFFHVQNEAGDSRLDQFVFSCRTMNMGLEQFIYERLGRPRIDVIGPVSNPIIAFDRVDWIELVETGDLGTGVADGRKLVLLGGCDLLQVANYCSDNRAEFVNFTRGQVIVRFDDPGFVLTSRKTVEQSAILDSIPGWSAQEAIDFDEALSDAKIVIVSMFDALLGCYGKTDDGVSFRIAEGADELGSYLEENPDAEFIKRCSFLELSPNQKLTLIKASLERIVALSPGAEYRFIIGPNIVGAKWGKDLRRLYNAAMRDYTEQSGQFQFVDLDHLVPESEIIDGTHFTRMGYLKIADHLGSILKQPSRLLSSARPADNWEAALRDVSSRAFVRKTGAPVGKLRRYLLRLPAKLSGGRISL